MKSADESFLENRGGTEKWGAAGGTQRARLVPGRTVEVQGTPQGMPSMSDAGAKRPTENRKRTRSAGESSGTSAQRVRRNETIRQKIIGRGMAVGGSGFRAGSIRGGAERGTFALLHEAAGQIGRGVFLEPLVEQGGDLLAEIGRVGEAREFVGLQGVAGSGEKEFPGSEVARLGHKDLRERGLKKYDEYNNKKVIHAPSNHRITRLWKSVEKKENAARCCSGCAGDYEDPDWSAWEADPEEEEGDTGKVGGRQEGDVEGD